MADDIERYIKRFCEIRLKIYKKVMRIVKNPDTVEDLLQDVQVKILENVSNLRPETFDAWVFRVAYHLSLDHLKKNNREQYRSVYIPEEENITERLGCYDESFESQIECTELYRALDACLRQLPIDNVNLIKFHWLEGLSYAKMGEKLGKPTSTISSKIQRDLKRLQSLLLESGFDKNML